MRSPFQFGEPQRGDESPHSGHEHSDSSEQTDGRVRGFEVSRTEVIPPISVRREHQVHHGRDTLPKPCAVAVFLGQGTHEEQLA